MMDEVTQALLLLERIADAAERVADALEAWPVEEEPAAAGDEEES